MKKYILSIFTILALVTAVYSQNSWSLQRCVEEARKNSIGLKQSELAVERNRVALIQSKHTQYPNLSPSLSYRINFGRTIDPTTNDFETKGIQQGSVGLNSNITVFNGGSIKNSIKQSQLNVESSRLDAEQFSNDLALTVVSYYINTLFAQERLDNARIQLQTTTENLNQIDKLIAAGSRPEGDRLDILAQQARDEQSIITNQNAVNTNKLLLKQLLQLPAEQPFEILKPSEDAIQPSLIGENLDMIYNYALDHRADMKSGDLKIKSSLLGVSIQKAGYLPSIGVGAGINSIYSSLGRKITGSTSVKTPVTVEFQGQQTTLNLFNTVPTTGKNPFFSQLDQNLGYGIGAQVSIPLYSNYLARARVRNSEIGVENQKLTFEQSKQTLKNNIQTALNEYEASKRTYEAAKRAATASQLAYNNTKIRHDLGTANSFELVSSKNRSDIAKVEEILGRYELIFRSKVLDFYMGRTITLN